jgi:hypothetical protein
MNARATIPPAWLPAERSISGSWESIRDGLYQVYEKEIRPSLAFRGLPVKLAKYPIEQGCEEGFWHVTSKEEWLFDPKTRQKRKERIFDERRSRKLGWLRPLLNNSNDPAVKVFAYREDTGVVRTYVWLEDWDYVIILVPSQSRHPARKGQPCWYLVTAFSVDYPKKRNELAAKLRNREP